ncbi:MAG: nitric oxide reductase NorD protein, partial [Kiritimatiellia bacterium]
MAGPRWRTWLQEAARRAGRGSADGGRTVTTGPAVRIATYDRQAAALFTRHGPAMHRTLGRDVADAYARVVERAVRVEPGMGRDLARELPQVLPLVPSRLRPRLCEIVEHTLDRTPRAAPLVARLGPQLVTIDVETLYGFLDEALELHRTSPEATESFLLRESASGQDALLACQAGVALEQVRGVLSLYARAHCGVDVRIIEAPVGSRATLRDGALALPSRVVEYGDERDFLVYRVMTAHGAGYVEFGTLDIDLDVIAGRWAGARPGEHVLQRLYRSFEHVQLARDLHQVLEDSRIESHIRDTYPGIARDLDQLRADPSRPAPVLDHMPAADQVVALLARVAHGFEVPHYARPDVRAAVEVLRATLSAVSRSGVRARDVVRVLPEAYERVALLIPNQLVPTPDDNPYEGRALPPEAADLGGFTSDPEDRGSMSAMAPPTFDDPDPSAASFGAAQPEHGDISGEQHEYDETIDDHRPGWVQVREIGVEHEDAEFADRVHRQRASQIRALRREFLALRPDAMRNKRRCVDGQQVDLDAAVHQRVLRKAGHHPDGRVYQQRRPHDRDVACLLLLDLSSSTNEVLPGGKRILDVEKEAALCLVEALDAIGDASAVMGFSGHGRQDVRMVVAKDFSSSLDRRARARIAGLTWMLENRDGAAIRHATQRLLRHGARTRLLILLSDGRPLDCGCPRYHGRYAQRDTAAALREARRAGVRPLCLTVDPQGADYLSEMYGRGRYL